MGTDYTPMWKGLGLDVEKHCKLLDALMEAYPKLYMSQAGRPKRMEYFDFVVSEAHGLRIKELQDHKAAGGKVVGSFCVFVPEEIILAAGGVNVGLCGGTEFSIPDAEAVLPSSLCPLIKSAFGFKLGRICPYFESADLLVGETTCDGKKKAWEIMERYQPIHVMEVPHRKEEADRTLWRGEVRRFAAAMEDLSGRKITAEGLSRAVSLVNAKRKALQRLAALRCADPAPISGKDALLVDQIAFYDDAGRFTAKVNELCEELEGRVAREEGPFAKGAPRLLVSGSPLALPNWKLHHVIETSGAVAVGEESCVGTRYFSELTEERPSTVEEMLDATADRHLRINCACFTPNADRAGQVIELARRTKAGGVIHNSLVFCQPYIVESVLVREALKKAGIPVLTIESDYGGADAASLKTRIEAFIETISRR